MGSSNVILRLWDLSVDPPIKIVRAVDAVELCQLIGWDKAFWNPLHPDALAHFVKPNQFLGLAGSLVGNAFSAYAVVPIISACLATYGILCENLDEQAGESIVVDDSQVG